MQEAVDAYSAAVCEISDLCDCDSRLSRTVEPVASRASSTGAGTLDEEESILTETLVIWISVTTGFKVRNET